MHYIVKDESPIAKSNPKMIKWARIEKGLSDEDIEYFYKNYKSWECGEKPTTWSDLRLIAKFYGRPSFFYFLEDYKSVEDYKKDYPILDLFEELQGDLGELKEELMSRLDLIEESCNVTVDLKDL